MNDTRQVTLHDLICARDKSISLCAKRTSIPEATLYAWCAGRRRPGMNRIKQYEELLGIRREYLRPDLFND